MKLKLIKDITPSYTPIKERVAIYQDDKGNKIVGKKSHLTKEKKNALFIENEANILKTLTELGSKKKIFPTFVQLIKKDDYVYSFTEFARGRRLDLLNRETRISVIKKLYQDLMSLTSKVDRKKSTLIQVRRPFVYLISFPLSLLRVILRNPKKLSFYLKMGFLFYYNYLSIIFNKVDLRLSHRDLWPDNILFHQDSSTITITDWESSSMTDPLYDLSQLAMIYQKDFGTEEMILFLREYLENNSERKRFIGLSIFNTMQMLAYMNEDKKISSDLHDFLLVLINRVGPALIYKQSLFEIINGWTLNMISLLYSAAGKSMVDRTKKIILCYHSIGNDGWRFSTRVRLFKSHLSALKSNYSFLPLSDLLMQKKGGIHISFDDGYRNVLTTALPILREFEVKKPTLFVLGDPENVQRGELENNLPLLGLDEVKNLWQEGGEIGYHTKTHPYLANLSEKELQEEIVESKKRLEKKLSRKINYFAYPKGVYSKKIKSYVKKAKFKAAFTVDGNEVDISSDRLLLDRLPIDGEMTANQLLAMASPVGLTVTRVFLRILQFKEKFFF